MHHGWWTQLFIMKNWGLAMILPHAFLSVMFLRFNIFSVLLYLLKVLWTAIFWGHKVSKIQTLKSMLPQIFPSYIFTYSIREVIFNFQKSFLARSKTCKDKLYFFISTLSNNACTYVFKSYFFVKNSIVDIRQVFNNMNILSCWSNFTPSSSYTVG